MRSDSQRNSMHGLLYPLAISLNTSFLFLRCIYSYYYYPYMYRQHTLSVLESGL